jgi:hypothetical protein
MCATTQNTCANKKIGVQKKKWWCANKNRGAQRLSGNLLGARREKICAQGYFQNTVGGHYKAQAGVFLLHNFILFDTIMNALKTIASRLSTKAVRPCPNNQCKTYYTDTRCYS